MLLCALLCGIFPAWGFSDSGNVEAKGGVDMNRKANGTKVRGRANGCGTLEKRRGVWLARWVVDGKRFTKSTGTGDRKEAEKALAELTAPTKTRNELARLENMAARISGKQAEIKRFEDSKPALSVADAFEAFRREPNTVAKKTASDTMDRYGTQFDRFARWLAANYPGAVELRNVSYGIAKAYAVDLQASFTANSYNKHLGVLRRVWKALDDEARLEHFNPWTRFNKMELDKSVRRELSTDELSRIGQYVEGEMRLLFAVGIYTGLRLGDAIRLEWEAVDLVRNFITAQPHKTKRHANGKSVIIPLIPPLRAILSEVPAEERKGPLCPSLCEDYNRDSANCCKKIQRVFAACGIETHGEETKSGRARVVVGFHSLRHSFVTLAAENEIPLAVVQEIVAHKSPAMTRHYEHISTAYTAKHMAAFPCVFAAGSAGALAAPGDTVDAEAVVVSETVELDADTLAAVDTIRKDGESRAEAIRRAVETLAKKRG